MKKRFFLLTMIVGLLPWLNNFGQQQKSPIVFAPSNGWVKPSEQPYRQEICLNGLWQFQPVRLPEKFSEGKDAAPALPRIKSDGWEKTPVKVPSPWNVNSFADKDGLGGDFRCYPSYPKEWEAIKMGWLRKKFTVPATWKGNRIQLHFEAVAGDAEILVNNKPAGKHFGIFLPFEVDVTDYIVPGKENELCIGIRKASLFDQRSDYGRRSYQAGSFWGQHAVGIWQDVYLVAVPEVRVSDVFVKPMPGSGKLEAEVSVSNDRNTEVEVSLGGQVYPWISKAGKEVLSIPSPDYSLGEKSSLAIPSVKVKVPAHTTIKVALSALVKDQLKYWSPESPNLYALVIQTNQGGKNVDSKYTRFGWRQYELKGNQFFLNGKPFVMKGDSWHFLGIPQMTRRYAWAWFKTMRDANLNTVRLHAQPYPSFYLDVADEMGILVLDETAVWASDGGPKLDAPAYWNDTEKHLSELILRDRNHACVMGWSVSNEVMPIVRGVMRNPVGMKDTLVKYYGVWADVCRKLDPTRSWISADGEDDGEGKLPTYIVHYGGFAAMERAQKNGKPWGVGEAGNAYYGTPEQVSETNGGRAYESFMGRMEGVAASSYQSLMAQRKYNAIYRSVFNMVWYGLKPLALGMKDTTKPPTLSDGVYFTSFQEGKPGVQPERIGPYCTTLNPGYDASLPLYQTWPLFDAIHDASAEPALNCKWVQPIKPVVAATPALKPVTSIKLLSGEKSKLSRELKQTGVPIGKLDVAEVPDLLIVDGVCPPASDARAMINKVFAKGGTVLVWGVDVAQLSALNALLPAPLDITSRKSSSLLAASTDDLVKGLSPADLYFSELRPSEIITRGLAGPLVAQSSVLLKACDTDWLLWNKQAEFAKTGMVMRSEREYKPSGAALISKKMGT
ncbi:MAG: glycoside hydrolase family 2 TIM barrel-domain containing protein, partial [Bacteroidales bacterium]|nr:glycoside hydrolase family 2 TIM barrel-domain containing protein [Bacteroidales bacterium]